MAQLPWDLPAPSIALLPLTRRTSELKAVRKGSWEVSPALSQGGSDVSVLGTESGMLDSWTLP